MSTQQSDYETRGKRGYVSPKDKERKALVKIRKIVLELGERSYLASAFEGAFELAESNIDLDAAFTIEAEIKQRVEAETAKIYDEALHFHEEASKRLAQALELERQFGALTAVDFAMLHQRLALAADVLATKLGY